jgi:hypothetical protein
MNPSPSFTTAEKHREARREVHYRKRVYARMVADGRMKKADADRFIDLMRAIEQDYAERAEYESVAERLI